MVDFRGKFIYINIYIYLQWNWEADFFSTSLCQAAENILSLLLGGSSESPRVLLSSGGGGGGLGASVSGVTWAFSPPHRGRVFSGGPDNAVEPLNSFVWLASIQACEPRPTQSAAIVTVRMLQQLCDRLQCYTAALSSSPAPLLCLSLYFHFFFLCEDPVILSQAWWLSSVPRPSFIFLIFCSSSSLPLSAMPYYSLSSSPARFSFFFFFDVTFSQPPAPHFLARVTLPCRSAVYFVCQIVLLLLCFREHGHWQETWKFTYADTGSLQAQTGTISFIMCLCLLDGV